MRNGTYFFLCMLLLALVLGGCAGTRRSFQTAPTPLVYEYETQELYASDAEQAVDWMQGYLEAHKQ